MIDQWRRNLPDQEIPDGHIFTQPWPAGPSNKRRDQTIDYQYGMDRAPAGSAWHRPADRQGRAGRRRAGSGETQSVHPTVRPHAQGQPH